VLILKQNTRAFAEPGLPGCRNAATASLLAMPQGSDLEVDVFHLDEAGLIPSHAGRRTQLCVVLAGAGHAHGAGAVPEPIEAGDAVLWQAEEARSLASTEGMTVLSIRARETSGS
jgi:hypothetical protein